MSEESICEFEKILRKIYWPFNLCLYYNRYYNRVSYKLKIKSHNYSYQLYNLKLLEENTRR